MSRQSVNTTMLRLLILFEHMPSSGQAAGTEGSEGSDGTEGTDGTEGPIAVGAASTPLIQTEKPVINDLTQDIKMSSTFLS